MEALYHAVLEASGAEREALLAQANAEVRRVVEGLLAQKDPGDGLLDHPAWELTASLVESPSLQLAAGKRFGPYCVDTKIGAGGMGEVYRATDTRLNRTVAIKVSPADFSRRFEREAKAIAALNHPNICQIYDVGPNYLVMEFVDGGSVVSKEREPIPLGDALRLATQIASAIEAAHAKGIIHRDLKPANILVNRDGVVKLLDFGIAKQRPEKGLPADEAALQTVTSAGMIIGTPAYMSPEQAEGKAADARSDIFSFGAVFYEMLTGRRAFPGVSAASVFGAILHKTPDPIDAPPALTGIVFKCLAKSPDDRFQTAADLLSALDRTSSSGSSAGFGWMTKRRLALAIVCGLLLLAVVVLAFRHKASPAGTMNSIAVLPLDMQSKDPEADYISDGIAASINNSLARLPGLEVIPNSVAMHYKGQAADFQKIGRTLGVQAVLSGRVVQHGGSLSINIELDDVRSGRQLWGQQYTRQVSDLLLVQNDIAKEVSQRLRSKLSAADQERLKLGSTANAEAYQLYLKGRYSTEKFTRDGFNKGVEYLNQAIALDPDYGLAHSTLAYNYINQDDWFISPHVAGPKAREEARKALAVDEGDAQAHLVLAIEAQWYEWDWTTAEREFKRAIELDPGSSDTYGYYAWYLAPLG